MEYFWDSIIIFPFWWLSYNKNSISHSLPDAALLLEHSSCFFLGAILQHHSYQTSLHESMPRSWRCFAERVQLMRMANGLLSFAVLLTWNCNGCLGSSSFSLIGDCHVIKVLFLLNHVLFLGAMACHYAILCRSVIPLSFPWNTGESAWDPGVYGFGITPNAGGAISAFYAASVSLVQWLGFAVIPSTISLTLPAHGPHVKI